MGGDRTEAELGAWLAERLGGRVEVRFGRAVRTPVQAQRERSLRGSRWTLRLHRALGAAPEPVLEDLARWLKVGKRARAACQRLDAWLESEMATQPASARRSVVPRPGGNTHDLAALAGPLVEEQFPGDFGPDRQLPSLTWGRRGRSRTRRSLRLGSYEPATHLVRVHPVLDQPAVPAWFVRFILFHELLHAVLPPYQDRGGRWVHHGPEFRARERSYPDHDRACAFETHMLPGLIRSARTGQPLRVPRQGEPGAVRFTTEEEPPPEPRPGQGTLFELE